MFKFQTTTLLNGATAANLVLSASEENENVLVSDLWRSEDFNNPKIVAEEDKYIQIERLGKFAKGLVTKIYRRDPVVGTPGKVEITCSLDNTITSYNEKTPTNKGIYRLNLYVRLGEGSQNSNFANVWVFKGKPFAFEVEIKKADATAADLAKAFEKAIKYETIRFGSKNVKVKADGAKLTIEAVGPDACYQYFTVVELQKFNSELNSALVGGEYQTYVDSESTTTTSVTENGQTTTTTTSDIVNTMCQYPFGTYGEILKDLRLPTIEHTSWGVIQPDEMPALGVTYTQFMIYMCVDRGIMGGDAVGEVTKSVTAHSIWVPKDAANAFGTLLATYTGITPEWHDADYKTAAAADANYTDNGGDTTQEAASAALTDQDGLNVKAGEALAKRNIKVNTADAKKVAEEKKA